MKMTMTTGTIHRNESELGLKDRAGALLVLPSKGSRLAQMRRFHARSAQNWSRPIVLTLCDASSCAAS